MRLYLVGFMGCGKTTNGKKLATRLNFQFADLDLMLEERYHMSTDHLFDAFGEQIFRELEQKLLWSTVEMDNVVISTGGGTPCYKNNMDFILKNGISIYFKMDAKSLYDRLLKSKKKRPLIKDLNHTALQQYIEETLAHREFFYNRANYIIKGENLNVDQLMAYIRPLFQ